MLSHQPRPEDRAAFLAERRESARARFDAWYSADYDDHWGAFPPTHARMTDRFVALVSAGGQVLDGACGTGRCWPVLLAAGLAVVGVDESEGMLARANAKHPGVETRALALQDLAGTADYAGRFDGVICMDAMEYVGPEDWPLVLAGFAAVLRPGGIAYLTVEVLDGPLGEPVDPRQVPGEDYDGIGYHYYPDPRAVRRWLADAGFSVVDETEGDAYHHLLLRRAGPVHRVA